MGVPENIVNAFCSCVAEWFDTSTVDIHKYDTRYHAAIRSQSQIGWRHIFMGHLSREWLHLTDSLPVLCNSINWGTLLVEASFKFYFDLWEQRNTEVHGKTQEDQQERRKRALSEKIRQLQEERHRARPSDDFLFLDDVEAFLDTATPSTMATYLASYTRAIRHSVKQAAASASHTTRPITQYFPPINPSPPLPAWRRDRLLFDAYNKKRRHRRRRKNDESLPSILPFLQ